MYSAKAKPVLSKADLLNKQATYDTLRHGLYIYWMVSAWLVNWTIVGGGGREQNGCI